MSALETGYEEMDARNRKNESRSSEDGKAVEHFPEPNGIPQLDELSLIKEEGPGSLVTPIPTVETDGSTSVKLKKKDGIEVDLFYTRVLYFF